MFNHEHRRPEKKSDFEGKTILRFEADADNIWRFWFTDGTAFAVQCEDFSVNYGPLTCITRYLCTFSYLTYDETKET